MGEITLLILQVRGRLCLRRRTNSEGTHTRAIKEFGLQTARTQLNPAMQALHVYLDIDGRQVRAIIPREVLESRFDAAPRPEAWIATYREHERDLQAVVHRRLVAKPQDFVVVRTSDFERRR